MLIAHLQIKYKASVARMSEANDLLETREIRTRGGDLSPQRTMVIGAT
jgi:hypothetical protein